MKQHSEVRQKLASFIKDSLSFDWGCLLFSLASTLLLLCSGIVYISITIFDLEIADYYSWITAEYTVALTLVGVFLFFVLYFISSLLFEAINRSRNKTSAENQVTPFKICIKRHFLFFFAILFVCWLPWIIAHYPGSLDQDTIWQTLIWRTPTEWYDHHPWLTTALFGSVMDLGNSLGSQSASLFIYTTIQALITAAMLSLSFCYIRRFNIPRIIWISFFVVACILPAYASYASQMVKDSFFVLFWIPFLLFFIEGIRTRGKCLASPLATITFILCTILVILANKKGIYLALPAILALCIYAKPGKRLICSCCLIIPLVFSLTWSNILLPSWGVDKGPLKELYSLPFQQTANYVSQYSDEVTKEERAAIDKVLPYESLPTIYTLTSADSVKDTFKDPDTQDALNYLATWIEMGTKHPDSYFAATMGTNYKLFMPAIPFELKENLNQEWVDEQVQFFSAFLSSGITNEEIQIRDNTTRVGLTEPSTLQPLRGILYTYEIALNYTPLRVINSPSFFAFYLPFFILCFALSKRNKNSRTRILLCLTPSALLVASIIVGPVILGRYCLPALLTGVLIFSLPWIMKQRMALTKHK